MGRDATYEDAFEVEIAEYLAAHGWEYSPNDAGYDRARALYPADLFAWLEATQPEEFAKVVTVGSTAEAKQRAHLLDTIVKRLDKPMTHGGGTLNVLRRPVAHINAQLRLCQFAPATTLNPKTTADYQQVRLRVVRQVQFSPVTGDVRRIDLVLFVNGIAVATIELKTFFKQKAQSAVDQYKTDRDPKGQPLLGFGTRAVVHFALDDDEVWMTTKLAGDKTHFLPFNRGTADGGKGNPPNPTGPAVAYLWEQVLQRDAWLNILGALMFLKHETDEDPITGKTTKSASLVFPRFHQWQAVTDLTEAVTTEGPGRRYLIQHSAGSGKTNTIAWTAHRLARLHTSDNVKVYDKVLVISDRKVIDKQLQDAVRQVDNTADLITTIDAVQIREAGSKSKALAEALTGKALIVIVTIQTFPFVADLMATTMADRNFAVVVDEAHTSQSGATAAELRKVLTAGGVEVADGEDIAAEDVLNAQIAAAASARATATNVSYFAFTATPKRKTLELFGTPDDDALPRPFHLYTMKQAIEEGFILDVLRGYQTYSTAFEIEQRAANGVTVSTHAGDDRLVDTKAAARGIMRFVKLHPSNIAQKVQIIVEHFRANVAGLLEGHAKAMVVTDSRIAAVRYKVEIDKYIASRGYGLGTIVAFSGDVTDPGYGIEGATEATLNPGLGSDLAKAFRRPEYRVMLVADKFQTGFDQPLLCAMYVDKRLPDVHAVQTLSRLNRTYRTPSGQVKDRTFVLDFVNAPKEIKGAFEPYYTEARVETTTDPNLVHELAAKLAEADIYTDADVDTFASAWFTGEPHSALAAAIKPAKDRFQARYEQAKDDDDTEQVDELELFRKDAGTYVRMYDFLSQVVDYASTDLEKLSVFLRQLVRVIETDRLGSDVDLSDLTLKHVRQVDRGKTTIGLGGTDATLAPIGGAGTGKAVPDPELALLSEVIGRINDLFGGEFTDEEIESFVRPVAAKATDNSEVAEQIDNNALDQFLDSPDLRDAVIDAALANEVAVNKLTGATTGEDVAADELINLIGTFMYRLRRMRGGSPTEQSGQG